MADMDTALKEIMEIDGAVGVALVDHTSGMALGTVGGGKDLEDASVLDPHRVVGNLLGVVALLMLIAVLIARPGMRYVLGTVGVLVLAAVGQPLFAGIGEDHRWVGGLHVLNGGVILVLAFWLHLAARKVPRA